MTWSRLLLLWVFFVFFWPLGAGRVAPQKPQRNIPPDKIWSKKRTWCSTGKAGYGANQQEAHTTHGGRGAGERKARAQNAEAVRQLRFVVA